MLTLSPLTVDPVGDNSAHRVVRRPIRERKPLSTTDTAPRACLSHLGFYVRDLDAQAEFYKRVFSLVETDRGVSGAGDPIVFLTGDSAEHHQLVLTAGLPADAKRTWLNQVSFRVGSLVELQQFHDWLRQCGVTPAATVSHGNAWSIYFLDPEGNNVEVYASSPWYVPQPFRVPVDLSRPADELLSETFESVREDAGFSPIEDWARGLDDTLKSALTHPQSHK
jgi:catechol 2,3-dioxygenase